MELSGWEGDEQPYVIFHTHTLALHLSGTTPVHWSLPPACCQVHTDMEACHLHCIRITSINSQTHQIE